MGGSQDLAETPLPLSDLFAGRCIFPLRVMAAAPSNPSFENTMPSLQAPQPSCTALKWAEDGELSSLDLQRILNLLSQADPVAEALLAAPLNNEASSCR